MVRGTSDENKWDEDSILSCSVGRHEMGVCLAEPEKHWLHLSWSVVHGSLLWGRMLWSPELPLQQGYGRAGLEVAPWRAARLGYRITNGKSSTPSSINISNCVTVISHLLSWQGASEGRSDYVVIYSLSTRHHSNNIYLKQHGQMRDRFNVLSFVITFYFPLDFCPCVTHSTLELTL